MNVAMRATGENAAGPGLRHATFTLAGEFCLADPAGVLVLPGHAALIVSDLHLEKGSSLAARGTLLPPYDSAATLARLGAAIARLRPRRVIALGDSFHDGEGPARLGAGERAALAAMQEGRDWVWIAGNHDPAVPRALGGQAAAALRLGALHLRHEPSGEAGEIAGHLHPVASVSVRGHTLRRRCFAEDGDRLIMPAFGSYAGGLNIRDEAFAPVFAARAVQAHLLGQGRVHTIDAARCNAGA